MFIRLTNVHIKERDHHYSLLAAGIQQTLDLRLMFMPRKINRNR